jgi:hypothetical protein
VEYVIVIIGPRRGLLEKWAAGFKPGHQEYLEGRGVRLMADLAGLHFPDIAQAQGQSALEILVG